MSCKCCGAVVTNLYKTMNLEQIKQKAENGIILCIPLKYTGSELLALIALEQEDVQIEECPLCKEDMLVSKKKREMRALHDLLVCCMICAAKSGVTPDSLVDINKIPQRKH